MNGFQMHNKDNHNDLINDQWITISETQGIVKNESKRITIKCSTDSVGSYSAYLIVKNKTTVKDISIVKIEMKVVSVHRENLGFNVILNGIKPQKKQRSSIVAVEKMELSGVHNAWTIPRSFMIKNYSLTSLDFMLSVDIQDKYSSKMYLSASKNKVNQTRLLNIPSGENKIVWVHFLPKAPDDTFQAVVNIHCNIIRNLKKQILIQA
eukprot:UN34399